jgi:hypothetical protein
MTKLALVKFSPSKMLVALRRAVGTDAGLVKQNIVSEKKALPVILQVNRR